MKTKFILVLALSLLLISPIYSQFDILDKVEKKVKKKAEEKVDEAVDKTVDDAMDGDKKTKEKKEDKSTEKTADGIETSAGETPAAKESLKSFSKFDFIPGDEIVFYDDFSTDAVADFPQKWNTNGSGEVVTLNNYEGKWFRLKNNSTYIPYLTAGDFTDNFTLEFDIIVDSDKKAGLGQVLIDLYNSSDLNQLHKSYHKPNGAGVFLTMHFRKNEIETYGIANQVMNGKHAKAGGINNQINDNTFENGVKNRVSISVNKQRYRLYVNENKVLDLPRLVPKGLIMNALALRAWNWNAKRDYQILVNNIKISKGKPDLRSQLVNEGRFVTRGILFDSGSDKIKPESYGTLKNIADVLKDNSNFNIKIIGHTDSDGDDKSNLELSNRRAASVKNALVDEFGIPESRFTIEGKGESEPVSDNNTTEGKASNRRVEFVKI